jgi:hypothetical protein
MMRTVTIEIPEAGTAVEYVQAIALACSKLTAQGDCMGAMALAGLLQYIYYNAPTVPYRPPAEAIWGETS